MPPAPYPVPYPFPLAASCHLPSPDALPSVLAQLPPAPDAALRSPWGRRIACEHCSVSELPAEHNVQVGAKLVVLNLSQQTDSSDLIGGFKPVEPRDALFPLLEVFQRLVRRTWSKGNNDDFLARVVKYAQRHKWGALLKAFQTAVAKVSSSIDQQGTAVSALLLAAVVTVLRAQSRRLSSAASLQTLSSSTLPEHAL